MLDGQEITKSERILAKQAYPRILERLEMEALAPKIVEEVESNQNVKPTSSGSGSRWYTNPNEKEELVPHTPEAYY